MENDPLEQRKAQKAVRLVYMITAVGILLPLMLWWFFGGWSW